MVLRCGSLRLLRVGLGVRGRWLLVGLLPLFGG